MTGSNSFWFAKTGDAAFYNGVATQSLRFDGTRNTTLYRDIAQAGNRRIATYAFWFKYDATDISQYIFSKGDGGGTQTSIAIGIFSSTFGVEIHSGDSVIGNVKTTRLLRDTSAWYHLVVAIDVTQSTASNKIKLYVNGVQQTGSNLSATTYPSDTDLVIGDNSAHTRERIGDYQPSYLSGQATGSSAGNRVYGYLCDFHHVDGQQLAASNFGEFKNGIWIAKDYDGNHGDNGFRLEFKQTGDGQTTAGTSTIGADTGVDGSGSATNNHFRDHNFEAFDSNLPDSPENNFCTLNPLARDNKGANNGGTYSEGNLKIENTVASNQVHAYGTMRLNDFLTDGCYFEIQPTVIDASRFYVGIINPESASADDIASYSFANKALVNQLNDSFTNTDTSGGNVGRPSTAFTISANDIVGVAVKGTSIWFHVNGTYSRDLSNNLGNPSTGANAFVTAVTNIATENYFPYAGYASSFVFNFGQNPTFNGYLDGTSGKEVGTETPDDGAGVFKYAVPTGFKALTTVNMPELTIGPNSGADEQAANYFDVFKYTGTGGDNLDVPDQTAATSVSNQGLGFKPDMVMTLRNDGGFHKFLTDSTRGGDKNFFMTGNFTHNDDSGAIKAFNAPTDSNPATNGGYRLGTSTNFNVNTKDYFSPCWKVNGSTTSTNEDGSIDSTVQVNTTAGISIVQATSPASGTWSVGHGLGVKPKWVILKYIANGSRWTVFFDGFTSGQYLGLNETTGVATSGTPFNFTVTDTLIGGNANYDSTSVVGMYYCFAEIDGFSKIGTFDGNASTDGTFVYTGFRPQMIIAKSQGSGNWHTVSPVFDHEPTNENVPINPLGYFNLSDSGSSTGNYQNFAHYDFLSNGFKLRDNGSESNAAGKFNFYAVATAPFKYSNAT